MNWSLVQFLKRRLRGWSEGPAPSTVEQDVKLIVGLGNPGREYARSRHNVGFLVLDHFAQQHGMRFNQKTASSEVAQGQIEAVAVVLAKPQTYMNLSGRAVQGLIVRWGVKRSELLVVYDDFDLPFGRLRLRPRGSAGTHNGMRSIVQSLGTDDVPRLRIGIGTAATSARDHVLGSFDAEEWSAFEEARERAVEAIEVFLAEGAAVAMNRFNR